MRSLDEAFQILCTATTRTGLRARVTRQLGPVFTGSAGVVLALTGVGKAWSAIGPARALDALDPVTGLPFRQLFLLAGLVELLVAFFCLFSDRRELSVRLVAWLSSSFLIYRLGLWSLDWHHPCGCMGSLAGMLHLSDRAADNIMKGVLAYLLIGTYFLLALQWRGRRGSSAAPKLQEGPAEATAK